MDLLPVASCLHRIHHNILRCHKGQLAHQPLFNHLRIHNQPVHHVQAQIQHAVDRQKRLRNGKPLVRGIIQCSLKPLDRRSHRRIQSLRHHISGEGSDPLTAHRVSFICHRRRTDLIFLKGFLHLFQVLQKPDIVAHLMGGSRDARKHIADSRIHFPGISLPGHRIALFKAHLLCDHRIDHIDNLLVSVKQFHKRSLGAGSPFRTKQLHPLQHMVQILQIQAELLHPKGCPFSHRSRLRRLEMGEGKRRKILISICKLRQFIQHIDQFFLDKPQCFRHHDNIRIISHIARCRAQMNNALRLRTLLSVSIHMAHHVMTDLFLPLLCHIVVDIVRVRFQFVYLLLGNIQPKLFFRLCKGDPQLSPGPELFVR